MASPKEIAANNANSQRSASTQYGAELTKTARRVNKSVGLQVRRLRKAKIANGLGVPVVRLLDLHAEDRPQEPPDPLVKLMHYLGQRNPEDSTLPIHHPADSGSLSTTFRVHVS